MADDQRRWPHLEAAFTAGMTEALGVRTGTTAPADLESLAAGDGYFRVSRGPGGDDGVTDQPLLDVESFASTKTRAWELAEDAREFVHGRRGRTVNGVLIDTVSTATGPVLVDWGNPKIYRYVASYRISFRKQ